MAVSRRVMGGMLLAAPALAQPRAWPVQPVRVIVPFSAGTADTLARLVGAEISRAIGQPLVAENRPGAGGNVGSEVCARAAPDGYTICLGTISSHAINPSIVPRMPYNNLRDFAPITQLAAQPNAIAVTNAFPARDIAGLITHGRANPELPFGTSGVGTSIHLAGALFSQMTGVRLTHVPYRGSAGIVTALLTGELPLAFDNLSSVLPLARESKLRILGVTSLTRSPAAPDIPTVAETLPGFESLSWHGLFAPARTPAAIVERLHREAVAALATPSVAARLEELGITPVGSTPEQFAGFVANETARWGAVARAADIRLD
jgi:tripartite-type tricarboxylate transporter receptor subunit TctC